MLASPWPADAWSATVAAIKTTITIVKKCRGRQTWPLSLTIGVHLPGVKPAGAARFTARLLCLAVPLRLPPGAQARAVDLLPPQEHFVDPPRVGDVIERVRIEDDEVGVPAGRHHPGVHLRDLGAVAGREHNRLHRCKPHRDPALEQQLRIPADEEPSLARVAAEHELHPG